MIKVKGNNIKISGEAPVVMAEAVLVLKAIEKATNKEVLKEICRLAKMSDEKIEKEANEINN